MIKTILTCKAWFIFSGISTFRSGTNYLPSPRLIPSNYRLGIYEVPDTVAFRTLSFNLLPSDWALFPYPLSTQTIGGDWLDTGNELGMLVPSSAVPEGLEKIVVINPRHSACTKIKLIKSTSDLYNKRTFTGLGGENN